MKIKKQKKKKRKVEGENENVEMEFHTLKNATLNREIDKTSQSRTQTPGVVRHVGGAKWMSSMRLAN